MVTNLPSPQPPDYQVASSPIQDDTFQGRLAIIPPRRERIVSAIEKIYSVIKTFNKEPALKMEGSQEGENDNPMRTQQVAPQEQEQVQYLNQDLGHGSFRQNFEYRMETMGDQELSYMYTPVTDSHPFPNLVSMDRSSLRRRSRLMMNRNPEQQSTISIAPRATVYPRRSFSPDSGSY